MSSPLPSFPAINLAEEHRRQQLEVRARFLPTLLDLWRILLFGDLRGTAGPWALRTAEAVIRAHQESARAGATYYNRARALPRPDRPDPNPAGIALPRGVRPPADRTVPRQVQAYTAAPTAPLDVAEVQRRLTGAALGRAASARRAGTTSPRKIEDEALAETVRVASLTVLDGGRSTVDDAIRQDPEAIGWCRLVDERPCAFCAMQASRGFVFKSAAAAGEKYHPGCACTPMARFRTEDTPLPPANRELSELWGKTASHFGASHYPGDNGRAARRAWRRALEAHQRGEDPVEAAWTDTGGQGRRGGKPAGEPDLPPRPGEGGGRRKRTRSGQDQDAALRKRLTNMEQALGQLEARRDGGEDKLDDLIDFHREEIERLRQRVGSRITPDEALDGRGGDEQPPPPAAPEPDPVPEPEPAEPAVLARARRDAAMLADEELEDAFAAAIEADDWDLFAELEAEQEGRDRLRREDEEAAARAAAAQDEDIPEDPRWARYDELTAQGMSDEEAAAEAFELSVDDVRRENARAQLLARGYTGSTDHMIRRAFEEYLEEEYIRAEDATRGAMLNARARRQDIDPRSLFLGNEATARARASDELLEYWDQHGRYTFELYRDELLNGTAAARRRFGPREDFLR